MIPSPEKNATDHDLLIELGTFVSENFKYIREDIKSLKDGTHAQLNDHEKRLREIEAGYVPDTIYSPAHQALIRSVDSMKKIIYMAMGGWVILMPLFTLAIKFIWPGNK